jgi:hypothetical protein
LRAFIFLKNRFKILYQCPPLLHTCKACACMLYYIQLDIRLWPRWPYTRWGRFQPDYIDVGHGVESTHDATWKNKRTEWAEAMWDQRSRHHLRRRRTPLPLMMNRLCTDTSFVVARVVMMTCLRTT